MAHDLLHGSAGALLDYVKRALAIAALAVLPGCSDSITPAGPALKLTIAEGSQPMFALVYVADAKGFFKQEGLDVTFTSFLVARDALTSVIEGKADIATVYETPVVIRLNEGKPLGIVSTLHTSTRNSSVVARRDRGIATPADLKGKRIGRSSGTGSEYFLSVFLATEGIAADSVTAVRAEIADVRRGMPAGEYDAVATIRPFNTEMEVALGTNAITFHSDAYVETSLLVGMRETIAAKSEAVSRMLRAIVRAQDFIAQHNDEAAAIVVQRFAAKFDEKMIRDSWPVFRPVAKLDNVTLTLLTREAAWFQSSTKFTGKPPDVREAFLPELLRAVRPDAVTLEHRPMRK